MFYAKKLLILLDFIDINHLQVETQNKHKLPHYKTEILKVSQIFVFIQIIKICLEKKLNKKIQKKVKG